MVLQTLLLDTIPDRGQYLDLKKIVEEGIKTIKNGIIPLPARLRFWFYALCRQLLHIPKW